MVGPRPAPPIVASKDKSVADEGAAREQPNWALTKTMVLSRPAPARVSRPEDRGSYSATGNGCKSRHAVAIRRIVTPSITIAATLAALCPILAQPSESGSISSGHQIAITICGNCHEDPTSSRKTAVGPKLEDIANRPSTTALSLKEFLRSRHKKRMPNFLLSRANTDDVIAYILSLKGK